ncbi:hypothetical protein HYPSUDRAFT_44505 [Hypholoma sublateritium FD-334 SS-4]|uniref:MYND-type domain-containing protein n=1 Tax=Hypholoma sublateritium (strain FD-334 SS-4) TaxID=945553 RepID=A0A0D2M7P5_HYPSF|nr:hypothetical protein HYPSUDRAFT_44505 [Hypholoma sublateritium FD-334 SS-4]
MHGICGYHFCEKLTRRRCAACESEWYCDRNCQRSSWGLHKFACVGRKNAFTTGDILYRACYVDLPPLEHAETMADFGFYRAGTREEQNKLLGVYEFCVILCGMQAKNLQYWRVKGILVQEIQKLYLVVPVDSRANLSYVWFRRNMWVFDGKTSEERVWE